MARSARARRLAALRGWETRRARAEDRARKHGKTAREKTESRLTPQQKAARTRDANRISRAIAAAKRSDASRRGWETRRANQRPQSFLGGSDGGAVSDGPGGGGGGFGDVERLSSLSDLEDYGDPEDYDYAEETIDTSPDYAIAGE